MGLSGRESGRRGDRPTDTGSADLLEDWHMYIDLNLKTKKAVKDAIAAGKKFGVYQPGMGPPPPANGVVTVEGPHYPLPHKWYGRATLENGVVVKIV